MSEEKRKYISKRRSTFEIDDFDIGNHIPVGGMDADDFKERMKDEIDKLVEMNVNAVTEKDTEYVLITVDGRFYSGTGYAATAYRLETDAEYEKRLERNRKQRENNERVKLEAKIKKENKEREMYERLKKKFENK